MTSVRTMGGSQTGTQTRHAITDDTAPHTVHLHTVRGAKKYGIVLHHCVGCVMYL